MNYKLKHLSKYCCKPETPEAFELVRLYAEIGGVEFRPFRLDLDWCCIIVDEDGNVRYHNEQGERDFITVLDFCKKLRMIEEEAEKLEDDRVEISFLEEGVKWVRLDLSKRLKAINGHYFKTNEDGTEVTLHKRD